MSINNKNGSLAVSLGANRPSTLIIDPVSGNPINRANTSHMYGAGGNAIRYSRDGKWLGKATGIPYVAVSNIEDDTWVAKTMISAGSTVHDVAFNDTVMMCAVSSSNFIALYDTVNFIRMADPLVLPPSATYSCDFSPDGTIAVLTMKVAPHIVMYDTSDWSVIANPASVPVNDVTSCHFSPDGAYLAMTCITSPFIYVYETTTWTFETIPVTPTIATYGVRFNKSSTRLAIVQGSVVNAPAPIVYDTSDWSQVSVPPFNVGAGYYVSGNWNDVTWIADDKVVGANSGFPGAIQYDLTEQIFHNYENFYNALAVDGYYDIHYEVNGTIDEALVADTWIATVTDLKTGSVLGIEEFTGTTFSVRVPTDDSVTVTVSAKQGGEWETAIFHTVDELVFPTDPISTPYYYKVTVAGITGATEPVWPVTAGGTVVDGAVTWQRVERLIQPITQSPLIPTVVV